MGPAATRCLSLLGGEPQRARPVLPGSPIISQHIPLPPHLAMVGDGELCWGGQDRGRKKMNEKWEWRELLLDLGALQRHNKR